MIDDPEPPKYGGTRTIHGYAVDWVMWQWDHGVPYRVCNASCGHYNQSWCVRTPTGETIQATVYWWPDENKVRRRHATINSVRHPGQAHWWEEPDLPCNRLLAEIDATKPADWHPWQETPPGWRAVRPKLPPKPFGRMRDAEPFPLRAT